MNEEEAERSQFKKNCGNKPTNFRKRENIQLEEENKAMKK